MFHRIVAACIHAAPVQVSFTLLTGVDSACSRWSISLEKLVFLLSFVDCAGRFLLLITFCLLEPRSTVGIIQYHRGTQHFNNTEAIETLA